MIIKVCCQKRIFLSINKIDGDIYIREVLITDDSHRWTSLMFFSAVGTSADGPKVVTEIVLMHFVLKKVFWKQSLKFVTHSMLATSLCY